MISWIVAAVLLGVGVTLLAGSFSGSRAPLDVTDIESGIDDLKTKIDAVGSTIEDIEKTLARLEGKVSDLDSKVDDVKGDLGSMESEISYLHDREMEKEIKDKHEPI